MTAKPKTASGKPSRVPAIAEHKRFLRVLRWFATLVLVVSVVGISTASRNPSGTQPNTIRSMSRADQVGKRVCLPEDLSASRPAMMPSARPVHYADYRGKIVVPETAPVTASAFLLSFSLRSPPDPSIAH